MQLHPYLEGIEEPSLEEPEHKSCNLTEQPCSIREIQEKDAEAFNTLLQTLTKETDFTLYELEEHNRSPEEQLQIIQKIKSNPFANVFVIEDDQRLIAYVYTTLGEVKRIKHTATIAMGILKAYWSRGYGKQLYMHTETWLQKQGIIRVALNVDTNNYRAISFYLKLDFQFEGIQRAAFCINNRFVDMYGMRKLLVTSSE